MAAMQGGGLADSNASVASPMPAVKWASWDDMSKTLQCAVEDFRVKYPAPDVYGVPKDEAAKSRAAGVTAEMVAEQFVTHHKSGVSSGPKRVPVAPSKSVFTYDSTDKTKAKKASVELRSEADELTGVLRAARDQSGGWSFDGAIVCSPSAPTVLKDDTGRPERTPAPTDG